MFKVQPSSPSMEVPKQVINIALLSRSTCMAIPLFSVHRSSAGLTFLRKRVRQETRPQPARLYQEHVEQISFCHRVAAICSRAPRERQTEKRQFWACEVPWTPINHLLSNYIATGRMCSLMRRTLAWHMTHGSTRRNARPQNIVKRTVHYFEMAIIYTCMM